MDTSEDIQDHTHRRASASVLMNSSIQDPAMEDSDRNSDQDSEIESLAPDTPLTPNSPKKRSKDRGKHLSCPYPDCDKAFNRPARLEEHKRSHTNERIFKCPEPGCTKDFLRKTHLKRHIEANHTSGPKSHVCQYEGCGMSFVTKQRLQRHILFHEKRDRYRCIEPGCGLSFRKHNTLNQHIRTIHQGQAAFPCDEILADGSVCPGGFASAHYLKLHKGQVHGSRSYLCTICPSEPPVSFSTFSELQTHTRESHPPLCEVCGYTAKYSRELALHMRNKHSNETLSSRQIHVCPFPACNGKGFVEKKNLNLHIRTVHEDSKPFRCGDTELSLNHVEGWDMTDSCGRAFSHKATLENHIRVMHMGLESMLMIRSKRKQAGNPPAPRPSKRSKPSKLDHLTGRSMKLRNRTIACPHAGCTFAFTREWDKHVHLDTYHGGVGGRQSLSPSGEGKEDDLEVDSDTGEMYGSRGNAYPSTSVERRLEAAANQGGPFWIGGVEEDEEDDDDDDAADAFFAEDALFTYGETCLEESGVNVKMEMQ